MLPVFGGYWLPSGAALGYAYILNRWQTEMADTLATGVDPFKATSMLPAAGFTVLYLSVLLITKKLLKDRPAYDCKPYMAVYNLYQVRFPLHTCPDCPVWYCGLRHTSSKLVWSLHEANFTVLVAHGLQLADVLLHLTLNILARLQH